MLYINCVSLSCECADAPHAGARIEIYSYGGTTYIDGTPPRGGEN